MTPHPLDPFDFLKFAKALAASDQSEVALRVAVGRAYYAVHIFARIKLKLPRNADDAHAAVIERIKRIRGYYGVADKLGMMRRLRTVADYEMMPESPADRNWQENWATVERLAEQIIPNLRGLPV